MLSRMSEPNRDELVSILKDLQQKVNTVVEKTNADSSGPVEATNSVEIETPAETVEETMAVPVPEPAAAVDTVMGGGRRKRRRTKKQCGGRRKTKGRKTKGRKGKGRSRKH